MSDDLVQFLRARLDEDAALAASGETWSAFEESPHGTRRVDVDHSIERVVACTRAWRGLHIARHDPARVLAEVDAKRDTLRLHTTPHTVVDGFCVEEGGSCTHQGEAECVICGQMGCTTVRLLALPYAEHPAYKPEWRP